MSDVSDLAEREGHARHHPRVGDRWTDADGWITLIKIEDKIVVYDRINSDGTLWTSRTSVPLPAVWYLAGRGDVPVPRCAQCRQEDAEPGQLLCWTCLSVHAGEWAGLSPEEARAKSSALIQATMWQPDVGKLEEQDDGDDENGAQGA